MNMVSAPPAHEASGQQDQQTPDASLPESRVLIIGTGGTICMQNGPDGLQPSQGFMESGMAPRPSFNDMSSSKGKFLSDILVAQHSFALDCIWPIPYHRENMRRLRESSPPHHQPYPRTITPKPTPQVG